MKPTLQRRGFLKTLSAAAGMFTLSRAASAYSGEGQATSTPPLAPPVLSSVPYQPRVNYPIRAKAFTQVTLKDSFWQPKMKRNAEVTIPFEIQKFREKDRPFANNILQGAIYSLQTYPDPKLQAEVDAAVKAVAAEHSSGRSTKNDNFEVAAAYFNATGKRDLLDSAIAYANAIYKIYQVSNPPFSGGERDAINCVALYSVTQDKRYLDLAKHYLDIRGLDNSVERSRHNQSYKPVLEQSEAVGHAVNDASLMVSLVDVGILTGLPEYVDAASRIWNDAVGTKLYITGGIGSTGNEGFGRPYALPNLSAYAETCAGIMFTTFNHKMFLATGDSKYIDVMERTMYNNVVDGVGASGSDFFYVNRLGSATDGRNVRWKHASLECCPPNLVRFIASMPGYIYAQRDDQIFVNLYVSSDAAFQLKDKNVTLSVDSEMPWGGRTKITIAAKAEVAATLQLRIPGWVEQRPAPGDLYSYMGSAPSAATILVNGKSVPATPNSQGYVSLQRTWRQGDVVDVVFPMGVRKVVANAKVIDNRGRMAIERGPIVYCTEGPDFAGGKVLTALVAPEVDLKPSLDPGLLGGTVVLQTVAANVNAPENIAAPIRLIPYHLWANRGVNEMAVWLSTRPYQVGDVGPAGGLIFYVNKNYASDGWHYLEAAPFDQSNGAKWGSFRVPLSGARGTVIGTGKQNTLEIKAGCNTPGIAADLCSTFTFNGFQDWYLPSIDELREMYSALKVAGLGSFPNDMPDNCDYWSSTQVTTDMARHLDFADNGMRGHYDDKDYPRRVRAIRTV